MIELTDVLEKEFDGFNKEDFLGVVKEYMDHALEHWSIDVYQEMARDLEDVSSEYDMALFCEEYGIPVLVDGSAILEDLLGHEKAHMLLDLEPGKSVYTAEELTELANKQIHEYQCRFCHTTGSMIEEEEDESFIHARFSFDGGSEDYDYFCEECYWKLRNTLYV